MWSAEPLDADAKRIIGECLHAAVEGPFFPDWEFHTLFGVDRDVVRVVWRAWPIQTVPLEDFKSAIVGSLGHLLGYPHGEDRAWGEYISSSPEQVSTVLDKLLSRRPS